MREIQPNEALVSRFPDLLFVIAGPEENNHVAHLHELAKVLCIDNKLHFTGLLEPHQRTAALVDADVFLLPSLSENFGMAAVEAMACGLPVVVSDQVGIADMINEEQAGIVTPLEPDAIASAVMKLLSDPQFARSMGAAGSRAVRQRYAPAKIARRMLAEFECILSERQRD